MSIFARKRFVIEVITNTKYLEVEDQKLTERKDVSTKIVPTLLLPHIKTFILSNPLLVIATSPKKHTLNIKLENNASAAILNNEKMVRNDNYTSKSDTVLVLTLVQIDLMLFNALNN